VLFLHSSNQLANGRAFTLAIDARVPPNAIASDTDSCENYSPSRRSSEQQRIGTFDERFRSIPATFGGKVRAMLQCDQCEHDRETSLLIPAEVCLRSAEILFATIISFGWLSCAESRSADEIKTLSASEIAVYASSFL
jgi:hypothetical protein